jgi:hypothetical protein
MTHLTLVHHDDEPKHIDTCPNYIEWSDRMDRLIDENREAFFVSLLQVEDTLDANDGVTLDGDALEELAYELTLTCLEEMVGGQNG